jgi:hypothetical protein
VGKNPNNWDDVSEWFEKPNPDDKAAEVIEGVRTQAGDYAEFLFYSLPECPERTLALRAVQKSMHIANAALALHGATE